MERGYVCVQVFPLHLDIDQVQSGLFSPSGVRKGVCEFLEECVPHMFIVRVGCTVCDHCFQQRRLFPYPIIDFLSFHIGQHHHDAIVWFPHRDVPTVDGSV
jgi:hypothetical protein